MKVETEYTNGFSNYYDYLKRIKNDEKLSYEDKIALLGKRKKSLLGNINFITELFDAKILNFKIFKIIILLGVYNFVKEYIRTEVAEDKFSIKEDYLESIIKLF